MKLTSIGSRRFRGVRIAAAIVACGIASAIVVPGRAMAQQSGGRGLTEEQVREIVRDELSKHHEEMMKMLQEHLGQNGSFFAVPPQGFTHEFTPGTPGLFPASGGWLGVRVSDGENGAHVDEVVEDSPAQKAGLQAGDVIYRVGDQTVGSASDLTAAISSKAPGTKLKVGLAREGEEKSLSVKLGARPDEAFTFSMPPGAAVPAEPAEPSKSAKASREKAERHEKEMAEKSARVEKEMAEKSKRIEKEMAEKEKATAKRAKAKVEETDPEHGSGPGFLGVQFEASEGGEGTVVTEVVGGSPAENAGIQAGDVLLSINGKPVSAESLPQVVTELGAGSRVKVKLMRGEEEQTIVLRLGSREGNAVAMDAEPEASESAPEPPAALRAPSGAREGSSAGEKKPGFLGVETRAIDEDTRETLGIDEGQGLLVQRVVEGSAAEKAGLQRNDLIVSIDGHNVATPDALGEMVRGSGAGHHSKLVIIRKGHRENVDIELGGRD